MDIELHSNSLRAAITVPDVSFVHNVQAGSDSGLADALNSPLGLPVLGQCVVPGDRVAIVVDPETPELLEIINAVWEQLQAGDASEVDATILLPPDPTGMAWENVLDELPVHLRSQAAVHVHDPNDEQQCCYLASSASGERIYLSHYLTDADLIVIIGLSVFDSLVGLRGTTSAIYPALSNAEALRGRNAVHPEELSRSTPQKNRELVDEIGWLLGTQFNVQVVPDSSGSIASVYAGAAEQVIGRLQRDLEQRWLVSAEQRFETTVTSSGDSWPQFSWRQFVAALSVSARLTEDGGRIIAVASLVEPLPPGLEMLRRCPDPTQLGAVPVDDGAADTALVREFLDVVRNHRVYLLCDLEPETVEELAMTPLATQAEIQRLLDSADSLAVLMSAGYVQVNTAAIAS